MFKYKNRLVFPIEIDVKDLKMAKYIITQFGGPNGELGAAIRYFSQSFSMPTSNGKKLLRTIAAEEFSHAEMIAEIVKCITKGATLEELKKYDLDTTFIEHGYGIFPTDSNGIAFKTDYIAVTGNPIVDLMEDMAAEEKARATYEHLIDICKDNKLRNILLFLRQREIVHFERFKELREKYIKDGYK